MSQSNQLVMEISIPLLGAVVSILTFFFGAFLCIASGCCPITPQRCRERRRRDLLLRHCSEVRYLHSSKCCANETCPICLEDFQDQKRVVISPCKHGFHRNCILHCLEHSPNCPVCKSVISDNRELEERTPLL